MCLGDVRFMPHVKWSFRFFENPANPTRIFNANPYRVGLMFPGSTAQGIRVAPAGSQVTGLAWGQTTGFILGTTTNGYQGMLITYRDYGDLTTLAWDSSFSGAGQYIFGEAVVPSWVMNELHRLAQPTRDFEAPRR